MNTIVNHLRTKIFISLLLLIFVVVFIMSCDLSFNPGGPNNPLLMESYVHWNKLDTPYDIINSLNFILIISPQNGFIVGSDGLILKSNDYGESWFQQESKTTNHLFSFSNSDYYLIVGEEGTILRSTDKGKNWTSITSATDKNLNSITLWGNFGYIVGDEGLILFSNDSGLTWEDASPGINEDLLFAHIYNGPFDCIVVGENGTILRTKYFSKNWQILENNTNNSLRSVHFVFKTTGYIVGDNGTILKTTDEGETWIEQTSNTTENLNSIFFLVGFYEVGYAVGDNGIILKTMNGGKSWSKEDSGTKNKLNSVYFFSKNLGWSVGEKGTILIGKK